MFSTSNSCKKTAACMVAMMMMVMMMMAEVTAMPKGGSQSRHQTKGQSSRKSSDDAAVETFPLHIDLNTLLPTRIIRPLENASISPWTYNVSHDASLYPQVLSEARCLLRGCLDKEGVEDLSLESRPIMHQVLLLRRVRSAGAGSGAEPSYHFRLESRLIAVGCTCVQPIVQHQH